MILLHGVLIMCIGSDWPHQINKILITNKYKNSIVILPECSPHSYRDRKWDRNSDENGSLRNLALATFFSSKIQHILLRRDYLSIRRGRDSQMIFLAALNPLRMFLDFWSVIIAGGSVLVVVVVYWYVLWAGGSGGGRGGGVFAPLCSVSAECEETVEWPGVARLRPVAESGQWASVAERQRHWRT